MTKFVFGWSPWFLLQKLQEENNRFVFLKYVLCSQIIESTKKAGSIHKVLFSLKHTSLIS